MFCKKCGAEIDDDAVFCPKCEANLGEAPVENKGKKSNKAALIISLIVIIAIVAGSILLICKPFNKQNAQRAAKNFIEATITGDKTKIKKYCIPLDSSNLKLYILNRLYSLSDDLLKYKDNGLTLSYKLDDYQKSLDSDHISFEDLASSLNLKEQKIKEIGSVDVTISVSNGEELTVSLYMIKYGNKWYIWGSDYK